MLAPILLALAPASAADPRTARCRAGAAEACVELGDAARRAGDDHRARRWYRAACTPERVSSCGPLLRRFDEGDDVVRDAAAACDRGDGAVCHELGRFLAATAPKDRLDHEEGLRREVRACELGHGPGCAAAASALSERSARPDDVARATDLLRRGCVVDDAESCHRLAHRLVDGLGVERSRAAALTAMSEACRLDRTSSCATLGRWLDEGRGGPTDPASAAIALRRACELGDAPSCERATALALGDTGPTEALAASLRLACSDGERAGCEGLLALLEAGRAALVPSLVLELRARPAWQAEACAGGHAPSCAAAAAVAEDPTVARQLDHEGRRLAALAERPLVRPSSADAGWIPTEEAVLACVGREAAALVAFAGRKPFTPAGRLAEDHVERALAAAGLATSRLPVVLPADGLESWIEVDGRRHPATPVERSAAGVFEGPVDVRDAPGIPRADAVVVLVTDLGAPMALDGPVDVPVLVVEPEVAAAAAASGRASGVSVPRGARPVADDVIGVLPGAGALAEETVVVGAHLDHFGASASGLVWPGADDNASGTAAMVCAAEALARELPAGTERRTLVFVGFTGEELGLFGSRAYVFDPPRPLDRTVAMVNLDMVGRLRDHALYARAYPAALAERAAGPVEAVGARLGVDRGPDGTSDHLVFAAAGVPALQLFTGMHGDHHETTDLASALNVEGLAAVTRAAAALALDLATTGSPPARAQDPCEEWAMGELGFGLAFTSFTAEDGRWPVRCVARGSPAEEMGLRPGDVVLRAWDDLARGWPTEPVSLPVRRGEACLRLSLAKAPEPVRCETVD